MGCLTMTTPFVHVPHRQALVPAPDLLSRICVRPPYFALHDVRLEGLELHATAYAESPAPLEVGPMPAAELGGRPARLVLRRAALSRAGGARRYHLARRAECRYVPTAAPYGAPVRFVGRLIALDKRASK